MRQDDPSRLITSGLGENAILNIMQNSKGNIALGNEAIKTRTQLSRLIARKREIAKLKGIPCDLTLNALPPIPEFCPALGIPLVVSPSGSGDDLSPSLDRIVPTGGYTVDNVVWVSNLCNRLKQDATWQELEKIAAFYKSKFPSSPEPKRPKTVEEVHAIRVNGKESSVYANLAIRTTKLSERNRRAEQRVACHREMLKFIECNLDVFRSAPFKYEEVEQLIKETELWALFEQLLPTEGAKIFADCLGEIVGENFSKNGRRQYYVF